MSRIATMPKLSPARLDLEVYRGDRLSLLVQVRCRGVPINISPIGTTPWMFDAVIKTAIDGEEIGFFDIDDTVAPLKGVMRMQLTEDQSQVLPPQSVWDMQSVDPAGRARTLLRGMITAVPDVTRLEDIGMLRGGGRRG